MTPTTHIATTTPAREHSRARVTATAASLAAIGAALANLAIYAIARAGHVDFTVRLSDSAPWSTVSAGQIAAVSVVAVLVGAGVAWLANRRSTRLLRWVQATGVVIAVASAGAPLSVTAVDSAAKPLLALMHVVTGFAFLYGTRRR